MDLNLIQLVIVAACTLGGVVVGLLCWAAEDRMI